MEIENLDPVDFDVNSVENVISDVPSGFTMFWDNVGKKVITRRPT